jgi:hypothetical protein
MRMISSGEIVLDPCDFAEALYEFRCKLRISVADDFGG